MTISETIINARESLDAVGGDLVRVDLTEEAGKALLRETPTGPTEQEHPFMWPRPGEEPKYFGTVMGVDVYIKPKPMTRAQAAAKQIRSAQNAGNVNQALCSLVSYLESLP